MRSSSVQRTWCKHRSLELIRMLCSHRQCLRMTMAEEHRKRGSYIQPASPFASPLQARLGLHALAPGWAGTGMAQSSLQ